MEEFEQAMKRITGKIQMLEFTRDDVPRIQEKKELRALEWLQKVVEEQTDTIHEQIVQIQALWIKKGDELGEVRKWSLEMEEQVAEFETITCSMREAVKNLHEEALQEVRYEEEKKEEEKWKHCYEEEIRMEIKQE